MGLIKSELRTQLKNCALQVKLNRMTTTMAGTSQADQPLLLSQTGDESWVKLFSAYDTDGSGTISATEWILILYVVVEWCRRCPIAPLNLKHPLSCVVSVPRRVKLRISNKKMSDAVRAPTRHECEQVTRHVKYQNNWSCERTVDASQAVCVCVGSRHVLPPD